MTDRPFMLLNRLVINGHGRAVYDQTFHAGVNIIRGENSSGKSTISDMIFYVLGGENVEWTDEAASCDLVQAEFNVSGLTLSLRREITSPPPSIAVCEGSLTETMKSLTGWSYYGRQRSDSKESFSQFMFDHLGLPQTKSVDSQANVTMYQVLRMIYGDQNTDCTSIFRRERQPFADRQDIRRSVGEMLLGIDDLQGHELRQEQIQVAKHLSYIRSRFDSLLEAAEKTDPHFRLSSYADLVEQAQEQQQALEKSVEKVSTQTDQAAERSKEDQAKICELEKQLANLNTAIERFRRSIESLSLNAADSEIFIASLESNLNDLTAANRTLNLIGSVTLAYCPICLADLSQPSEDHCPLCKASTTGDAITGGRLRYEQELKHQINESKQILGGRRQKLVDQENALKEEMWRRNSTLTELRALVAPTIHIDAKVSQLLKDYGYLTRKIEDLTRLESLQTEVDSLEKEVQKANSKLEHIERQLKLRQAEQEERRNYCQQRIGDLTIGILHEDVVDNQNDTLNDSTGLVFSFEKDFLTVRHGRLSASTQAFLKNSFYLGLLKFAVEDGQCRLPRFFILDNIEDKGMVPERFRKFHHLLIQYSEHVDVPHQVILTTSYIDEELDNSQYCVGPSYDQPPFTLDLKGEWSGLGEVSKPSNTDDVTGSASETQMPEDDGSSIVAGKE